MPQAQNKKKVDREQQAKNKANRRRARANKKRMKHETRFNPYPTLIGQKPILP